MSGVPLEPVYGPEGAELPGQYPYTRGPYASMYRSRLWTMRQFAGFGTATDTNGRFKELLRSGGDGLSTAFDINSSFHYEHDAYTYYFVTSSLIKPDRDNYPSWRLNRHCFSNIYSGWGPSHRH